MKRIIFCVAGSGMPSNPEVYKNPFCATCNGVDISDVHKLSNVIQPDHAEDLPEVEDASSSMLKRLV